jgi:hypothetical protein
MRRLRAWWRQIDEDWRKKRDLLLDADQALQELGYGRLTFEEIELYLLRIGVLHLESATYGQMLAKKVKEAGIREGAAGAASPPLH